MQLSTRSYNQGRVAAEHVLLCVGLGHGELLRIGDHDVFGAEVNAASKLGEDVAGPSEILVTQNVLDVVGHLKLIRGAEPMADTSAGASAAYRLRY